MTKPERPRLRTSWESTLAAWSWYARLYDIVMSGGDRFGLARRRRRLGHLARGRVLEIGAGTGLQFRHYRPDTTVFAIEPDEAMLARARRRQHHAAACITLVIADARALPFRDGAFHSVVCALVFCTIPDPARAAREMRRVLNPTGSAYLLEHVRARHRVLARIQEVLTPVWARVAGGCQLARRTADLVRQSGFEVEIHRESLDGALIEMVGRPIMNPSDQITHSLENAP